MDQTVRAKFRVKIRSLAAEAQIIRHEERKAKTDRMRSHLRQHRITIVRNEQRATLLALAYLRGIPYKTIERQAYKTVPLYRMRQICQSLGNWTVDSKQMETWSMVHVADNKPAKL